MYKEKEKFDAGGLIILGLMVIPELVFLLMSKTSRNTFTDYPFWALTLYLILLFLMICSSCSVFSKNPMKVDYKNPFVYLILTTILIQLTLQYYVFQSNGGFSLAIAKAMNIMFIVPFVLYSITRKNLLMFSLSVGLLIIACIP